MSDEGYCGALHGCATGDCPHTEAADCQRALISELEVADRLLATLRTDLARVTEELEESRRMDAEKAKAIEHLAATVFDSPSRLTAALAAERERGARESDERVQRALAWFMHRIPPVLDSARRQIEAAGGLVVAQTVKLPTPETALEQFRAYEERAQPTPTTEARDA